MISDAPPLEADDRRTLSPELLEKLDAYWRAANYLSVGQIYLRGNPLMRRPLELSNIKHMLLGHWGTTPGQNFIYAHLNRVIKQDYLDMIYVSGPAGCRTDAIGSGTLRARRDTSDQRGCFWLRPRGW